MAIKNVSFIKGSPADPYADAERQRALADYLQQQALQSPITASKVPLSNRNAIGLGITQLGQALLANRAGRKADQADQVVQARTDQATADYNAQKVARIPEMQLPALGGREPIQLEGTNQEDATQAVRNALVNRYSSPELKDVAKMDFQTMEGDRTRADVLQGRKDLLNAQLDERKFAIGQQSENARLAREQQARSDKAHEETLRAVAGNRPPAAVTPVTIQDPKDPSKTIVIDGRTGQVLGTGPKLTQQGGLEAKRSFTMAGLGSIIDDTKDLLNGVTRDQYGQPVAGSMPTHSGGGRLLDMAGNLVGFSTDAADKAAKLRAAGAALVTKMPRMEGPQSDKDTLNYKEMAGQVGDATLPLSQRLNALGEVEKLWRKYDKDDTAGGGNADIAAADKILGL